MRSNIRFLIFESHSGGDTVGYSGQYRRVPPGDLAAAVRAHDSWYITIGTGSYWSIAVLIGNVLLVQAVFLSVVFRLLFNLLRHTDGVRFWIHFKNDSKLFLFTVFNIDVYFTIIQKSNGYF